jgi:hypothetical protein
LVLSRVEYGLTRFFWPGPAKHSKIVRMACEPVCRRIAVHDTLEIDYV